MDATILLVDDEESIQKLLTYPLEREGYRVIQARDGHVIGGIGVGSGTGEQDRQVANAALAALTGAKRFG